MNYCIVQWSVVQFTLLFWIAIQRSEVTGKLKRGTILEQFYGGISNYKQTRAKPGAALQTPSSLAD